MLLPILDYLSLDDQGGDGNVDALSPAFSLKSALRSEKIEAKQKDRE